MRKIRQLDRATVTRLLSPNAKRSAEMQAAWEWNLNQDPSVEEALTTTFVDARKVKERQWRKWNVDLPEMKHVHELLVPEAKDGRRIHCQLVTPQAARPGCIVYCHGGGWMFGGLESHAYAVRVLAMETRTRVLTVDYRLAPEHPYPAAINDIVVVWRWLETESTHNPIFNGPRSIGGDSSGANIAVATAFHEIQVGSIGPRLLLLFYGVYCDDLETVSFKLFGDGRFSLTRGAMQKCWNAYAPANVRNDPLVCPSRADDILLSQLPPVYLNGAGLDPLLSSTLAFAKRLNSIGHDYELVLHEGVHHGFMQMVSRLTEARRAFRNAGEFYYRHSGM